MKRFAPAQIEHFLVVLDGNLERNAQITIIGGSALAIGYGVARATNDIDTFQSDLSDVETAAAVARQVTGLEIPIANVTIAQLPEGAEQEHHPLSLELLIARYVQLLEDYVGDPTEPRWSFVHFVDEVWDELAGVEARRALGLPT